jgi:hypothetical protein
MRMTHRTSGSRTTHELRAYFGAYDSFAAAADIQPGCTTTSVAGCIVIDCAAATPITSESAGALSVKDSLDQTLIEAALGGDGYRASGGGRLYEPVDTLVLGAVGDSADAFSVTLDAPELPQGLTMPSGWSRTASATFSWTSAPFAESVSVEVISLDAGKVMRCEVQGDSGSLVIPAAALAALPTGSITTSLAVSNSQLASIGSGRSAWVGATESLVSTATLTD